MTDDDTMAGPRKSPSSTLVGERIRVFETKIDAQSHAHAHPKDTHTAEVDALKACLCAKNDQIDLLETMVRKLLLQIQCMKVWQAEMDNVCTRIETERERDTETRDAERHALHRTHVELEKTRRDLAEAKGESEARRVALMHKSPTVTTVTWRPVSVCVSPSEREMQSCMSLGSVCEEGERKKGRMRGVSVSLWGSGGDKKDKARD